MIVRYSKALIMRAVLFSGLLCVVCAVPCPGDDTAGEEGTPSAAKAAVPIKVRVQFVQLTVSGVSKTAPAEVDAAESVRQDEGSTLQSDSSRPTYELAVQEAAGWLDEGLQVQSAQKNGNLQYGTVQIALKDGVVQVPSEKSAGTSAKPSVRVLLAPTMIVTPNQPAAVMVGERVPFMEKRDDGSLVVKHSENMSEGIELNVLVDEAGPELVSFQEMSIKISKVVGRQEIEGVPFDVGRPIVRSAAVATSLRVGYEHVVAISVPNLAEDQAKIVVLLGVERAE